MSEVGEKEKAILFCATPEQAQECRAELGITSPVVHGKCEVCEKAILWATNVPPGLTKVCADCGFKIAGKNSPEELDIQLMPQQRRELEDLLTKVNPLNPVAIWVQQLLDKTKGNC